MEVPMIGTRVVCEMCPVGPLTRGEAPAILFLYDVRDWVNRTLAIHRLKLGHAGYSDVGSAVQYN